MELFVTMSDSTRLSLRILSSRSEDQPVDPSLVPFFIREITVSQYFQVAIVAVLVYDACESLRIMNLVLVLLITSKVITLDKEVSSMSPCGRVMLSASNLAIRSDISG